MSALLAEACRISLASPRVDVPVRAPRLHQGLIASGDQFVSTARSAALIRSALRGAGMEPLALEMEGAAVAQVCHDYGIPFAAVRTISDRSDEDSPTDFQHFVTHVASQHARAIIGQLMQLLPGASTPGHAPTMGIGRRAYLSQPRRRKYHIGTMPLAAISNSA